MKTKHFILAVVVAISFHSGAFANDQPSLSKLAQKAISTDSSTASAAITSLREQGQSGLNALLAAHANLIQEHDKNSAAKRWTPQQQAAWERLQHALDAVGAQRDCAASHLFWHTNFDAAKAAAKASGKPILSLRLLGNLNEEYSCANSRFFRTTLYANTEVSQYLRDHFILHWKSVRPVPRITIDFGDGRKIERTITGNSIHYVLDSKGRVIDALPGIYGPKAFLKGLADAETAALRSTQIAIEGAQAAIMSCGGLPIQTAANNRELFLQEYHAQCLAAIQQASQKDLLMLAKSPALSETSSSTPVKISNPSAFPAASRAVSKGAVELPMLKSFETADDATWSHVAALHREDTVLDESSVRLIASKNPTAFEAGRVALTKWQAESPLTAALRNLQRSIAEDTVRNGYLLHSKIHEWFINRTAPEDVDQLNSLVYAKLFLTPDSDPWLGLVPANTFTGLDNNGLVQTANKH